MKHATAEVWDGEKSPYRLRVEEFIGDKYEVVIDSPEESLQSAWDHVERLRKQTGSDIWLKGVHRVFVDGKPIIIRPYFYDNETRRNSENKVKGLGVFASEPGEYNGTKFWRWWYKAPSRPWTAIGGQHEKSPIAPPLPKPKSEWRTCGCREHEHVCGACGKPYWVELHGVADGYCTYCYYAG